MITCHFNRSVHQLNSLLSGSTEFSRRSTNSNGPISRITIEFAPAAKTGKGAAARKRLIPRRRTPTAMENRSPSGLTACSATCSPLPASADLRAIFNFLTRSKAGTYGADRHRPSRSLPGAGFADVDRSEARHSGRRPTFLRPTASSPLDWTEAGALDKDGAAAGSSHGVAPASFGSFRGRIP